MSNANLGYGKCIRHRFTKLVREVKHNSQNLNLQNNDYIYIGSNSK